jgi:hypothetical protein
MPLDGYRVGRYGSNFRSNPVGSRDFSLEEIEEIIRQGDLDSLR